MRTRFKARGRGPEVLTLTGSRMRLKAKERAL